MSVNYSAKWVKFHSNGRVYYWSPQTRQVITEQGRLRATNCYDLNEARKKVS